jgi:pimeloyl-ACP methyl ester carboxylesterase
VPVLVLVGEKDTLVGPAEPLADGIPGAALVKVPGDHLSAVAAPEFKQAIVDFLRLRSPVRSSRDGMPKAHNSIDSPGSWI